MFDPQIENATNLMSLAPARKIFSFLSEPTISEGPESEKDQHYIYQLHAAQRQMLRP